MTDSRDSQPPRSELPAGPQKRPRRGRIVVISGPSGVGKGTVRAEVAKRIETVFSISATTRNARPGEVDGVDYRFVDREAFEQMIARDEMLEWAEVFGEYYGTPAAPAIAARDAGRVMLLEIDVQGGLQVAERVPEAVFILLTPPSDAELARRLRGRGTEDEATVQRRLAKANEEIRAARDSGVYTYEVVNDRLGQAAAEVLAILEKETDAV
jgi:guanylate kinase